MVSELDGRFLFRLVDRRLAEARLRSTTWPPLWQTCLAGRHVCQSRVRGWDREVVGGDVRAEDTGHKTIAPKP